MNSVRSSRLECNPSRCGACKPASRVGTEFAFAGIQNNHPDREISVSRTKRLTLALAGIAALGGASAGQAKVIALQSSVNTVAPGSPATFANLAQRADGHGDYVQSAYHERSYGILSPSAANNANYEPAAARHGMQSFRELSDDDAPKKVNGGASSGPFGPTGSRYDRPRGMTDGCVTLLTLCALAAYQLRRKQQLLKRLPFSP